MMERGKVFNFFAGWKERTDLGYEVLKEKFGKYAPLGVVSTSLSLVVGSFFVDNNAMPGLATIFNLAGLIIVSAPTVIGHRALNNVVVLSEDPVATKNKPSLGSK